MPTCWALLAFTFALYAAGARVPNSPFPVPPDGLNASTSLYYIDPSGSSPDDVLTLATLQGALSRLGRPRLYRAQPASDYALWAQQLSEGWGVTLDTSLPDVWAALAVFRASITGYVLANLTDGSVNAAVAYCSSHPGAIAVTPVNAARAAAAGLTLLADVRGRDLEWVLDTMGVGAFSSHVTLIQDPSKTGMSDWAIASGALPWFVPDAAAGLAPRVWGSLNPPFFALGWGPDELGTVAAASKAGGGVIASDWAENLDALSAYDVPSLTQKPRATTNAPSETLGRSSASMHTAAFLMSDGDNVQWLLGGFATGAAYFGSPDRGRVPMGWTISPSLVDLAPAAMRYLYNASTPLDIFVGGLSGGSYSYVDDDFTNADFAQKLNLTFGYARKAGLSTHNIMTHGATLAPAVAAAYLAPASPLAALYHYSYADYALGGGVSFVGDRPIITARFNLWGDGSMGKNFFNVTQAVSSLVSASRNPTCAEGYSLIVVHAWSHNVSDARAIMDAVNAEAPGAVAFVTPDVLAARVAAHVVH